MILSKREMFLYIAGISSHEVDAQAQRLLEDPTSLLSRAIEELRGGTPDELPFDARAIVPASDISGTKSRSMATSARLKSRRNFLATACILLVGTTMYAGWTLVNRPLLSDDMTSGWFNSLLWIPPVDEIKGGGVRAEIGHLRLINRGYLRPRQELPTAIEIQFDWKWNYLGLDPLYAEHLSVALRTNGNADPERSFEVTDGVIVKLNAWSGNISIISIEGVDDVQSPTGNAPLPADEWHRIRITDDGETISVYVTGPLIKQDSHMPLLQYHPAVQSKGKSFAVYNREKVKFPHESCIRRFSVRHFGEH